MFSYNSRLEIFLAIILGSLTWLDEVFCSSFLVSHANRPTSQVFHINPVSTIHGYEILYNKQPQNITSLWVTWGANTLQIYLWSAVGSGALCWSWLCSLMYLVGIAWETWLHSMSSLITQQARPGLFSWQWQGSKRERASAQSLLMPRLRIPTVTHLLFKASHHASPDPRGGEIDFIS